MGELCRCWHSLAGRSVLIVLAGDRDHQVDVGQFLNAAQRSQPAQQFQRTSSAAARLVCNRRFIILLRLAVYKGLASGRTRLGFDVRCCGLQLLCEIDLARIRAALPTTHLMGESLPRTGFLRYRIVFGLRCVLSIQARGLAELPAPVAVTVSYLCDESSGEEQEKRCDI